MRNSQYWQHLNHLVSVYLKIYYEKIVIRESHNKKILIQNSRVYYSAKNEIFFEMYFFKRDFASGNIGFIAVVLFISSTTFEKSSSFYHYTSAVSTSHLINLL